MKQLLAAAVIVLAATGASRAALISAWNLDEASKANGVLAVDSVGTNSMTYNAAVAQAVGYTGVANTAASFNGTSTSYATRGNRIVSQLPKSTISAWFKMTVDPSTNSRFIYSEDISSGTVFYLRVNGKVLDSINPSIVITAPQVEFGFRVGGVFKVATDTSVSIDLNKWYFAAGVFDSTPGAGMKVYVFDGTSLTSGSNTNTTVLTDNTVTSNIGRIANAPAANFTQFYFQGAIDNVRAYNSALSSAEILASLPEPSASIVLGTIGLGFIASSSRRRDRSTKLLV